MNKVEKEIVKEQLKREKKTLAELRKAFELAKKDCEFKIAALNARKDMQNLQSVIYQKKYQMELLKSIDTVLKQLNGSQYELLDKWFHDSYISGFLGSVYNLHNQGIPLIIPIDQDKVLRSIKTDALLSDTYYQDRVLPENLVKLKENIRIEITRGISSGKTWLEIAYQIGSGMNSPFNRAMHDAMRIARTEGHRINQQGFLDASIEASEKGAKIKKQWDSTLDGNTRESHRKADGQIKDVRDFFIVDGEEMSAPGVGGSAKNVCNCRCQLLQRASWNLDNRELRELEHRSRYYELWFGDKPKDLKEFKKTYLKINDVDFSIP